MALRIVQLTDPHLLTPGEELMGLDVGARFEAALQLATKLHPDAIFLTGDFCAHEPVAEVYRRLRRRLDGLRVPYFVTAGNHDDRRMMREAFPLPGCGDEALNQVVELKGRAFLILDSSPGYVDDQQLDWLARALADYPGADIVMHHPPLPLGIQFMDETYPLRDTDRLLALLTADGNRRRIFCGHYHANCVVSHRNLEVMLCPPTSFFIDPSASGFELEPHPPGCQLMEWTDEGDFLYTVYAARAKAE